MQGTARKPYEGCEEFSSTSTGRNEACAPAVPYCRISFPYGGNILRKTPWKDGGIFLVVLRLGILVRLVWNLHMNIGGFWPSVAVWLQRVGLAGAIRRRMLRVPFRRKMKVRHCSMARPGYGDTFI